LRSDGSITTSCSVSLNVCFESGSSVFIGGSQNGCDDVFADVKLIILLLVFSSDFMDDVEPAAIHSSELVTSESFGRGTDAYLR
jgi:hypothetical protein